MNSLNYCVVNGPCFLPHIPNLLTNRIAILADVEKAFSKLLSTRLKGTFRIIGVQDQCNPRFTVSVENFRYKALIFGLPCSPEILECTCIFHVHLDRYRECEPEERLKCELYVDNIVYGTNSLHEAIDLKKVEKYSARVTSTSEVQCNFVMAKSRFSPKVKPQTITHLELFGASILFRLLSFFIIIFPGVRYLC